MEQGMKPEKADLDTGLGAYAAWYRELFQLPAKGAGEYSPLVLAYLGDAVYEIAVRSYTVLQGNTQVEKLHKKTSSLVNAGTQAAIAHALKETLSEEELTVLKRGRNAHSYTKAKNASTNDYRWATGLEALTGYLFLEGRYERLTQLIHDGLVMTGNIPE